MRTRLRKLGHGAALALPFALAACQTLIKPPEPCGDDGCASVPPIHEPKITTNPTMHALATDLDHLEKHVDWYGSVVAKAPDVWGQARLTRYREEFEMQMSLDNADNQFKVGLQGSLARSDQAFFAHATALSLAAQPKPPVIGRVESTKVEAPALVPTGQTIQVVGTDPTTGVQTTTNTTLAAPTAPTPTPTPAPAAPTAPTGGAAGTAAKLINDPADTTPVIKRGLVANGIGFGAIKDGGIGLEPSLFVAQKKRHLDFLNQIRRENEGDDTADGPGYSLNLIRVPVSVLPGKRTDVGHGAEITMTLTPVLGDDLLPVTFRNLVLNDLLHQLGFPATQVLGDQDPTVAVLLNAEFQVFVRVVTQLNDDLSCRRWDAAVAHARAIKGDPKLYGAFKKYATTDPELLPAFDALAAEKTPGAPELAPLMRPGAVRGALPTSFQTRFAVPTIGFAAGLDNRTAFPTSQLLDVYGAHAVFEIVFGAQKAFATSIARQKYAHLPDIQSYIKEEAGAAYELLRKNPNLVAHYCTPALVQAIRSKRVEEVLKYRQAYRTELAALTGYNPPTKDKDSGKDGKYRLEEPQHLSVTAALAWCIIVDSALLNDRLVRDMREAATAKKQSPPPADHWPQYYLPEPPTEARCAFNTYVAMRWPIRVFALDPYTQDQNIADQFSSRREMQLALSIAFTNGFIGVDTLTKYTRRLEAESETIALNRTQVGFGHGENTFGWRFYPRFQTPDTESNLTVFTRDLLIGGPNRNALLRQRRLEPGPRECVAVVMMPSFVPYATLDTTSNWFGLANPKHKVLDHTQALKLSHTVHAIKNAGCGVKDANCYRDGELGRLLRRVEQLESRLPSQTLNVPVPAINTLGGFEMFSNGTTDLAPELYGWYGAPGVSTEDDTTTLFLVGDHFSPLNTKVIVGNRAITNAPTAAAATGTYNQKMLSRQVVQVTVPRGTLTVLKDGRPHVTAHIATPYGVTRELLIPVVSAKPTAEAPKAAEGYKLDVDALELPYCKFGLGMEGKYLLGVVDPPADAALKINWADALSVAPQKVSKVTFGFEYNGCPFAVTLDKEIEEKDGAYTIDSAGLKVLVTELLRSLNQFRPFTDDTNPLTKGVKVTSVKLTPVDPKRAVTRATVAGELTLKFACQICKDGAHVPVAEPKKDDKKDEPKKENNKEGKEKDDKPALAPLSAPVAPPTLPLPAAPPLPRS
ncbi:Uncharacterized protein OS=Singulisphaera acidiphila (strain ATCC BAA-1392 / DSM 18658 / VKM B-2454 / MOB10) GN=Sinac_2187 PE=4 SV=1 [Gemmata massiliana]|uniref:Uncharacterized protein n=1 Tax=Gemmata massiliana TaxID=1210884 RepID=A0A6P2CS41_9BACT|nr:hypothetical protein [Gemmata massiliana]VTR91759.1 Uncharacterized protein OS=Singulisphaera acidiphila (strain ATCC BAA-1392 / DSM 18658 / VKM B-2454 / MOB10) GN=Sinac_2187 PE=4 SV=1 [Gemmata massiliana]